MPRRIPIHPKVHVLGLRLKDVPSTDILQTVEEQLTTLGNFRLILLDNELQPQYTVLSLKDCLKRGITNFYINCYHPVVPWCIAEFNGVSGTWQCSSLDTVKERFRRWR